MTFALTSLTAFAGETDALLKCTREVVQSRRTDSSALSQLGRGLQTLGSGGSADQALTSCKEIKVQLSHLPRRKSADIKTDIDSLEQNKSISYGVQSVLQEFNQPMTSCKVIGIDADAAVGVGVGAGIAFGKCQSQSGRKFGVVVPMVSALVGFMADAQLVDWNFSYAADEAISAHDGILIGLILSFRADRLDFGFGSTDTEAVGVGIGIAGEDTFTLPIKLLPLGNDFTVIKSTLGIK